MTMTDPVSLPIVLVVDDELEIRRFLRVSLRANQFEVHEAATGADGLARLTTLRPDVVILDLSLPDMSGLDVLLALREWSRVPVIALSARHDETDKIAMLDAGANDYLTKPFGVGELMARIRAARRVTQPSATSSMVQVGNLKIDFATREVSVNSTAVKLTKTEYALLHLLAEHPGKVLTHRQLLRGAWGPEYENETHYLRVYMGQLRKKIETDPNNPRYIVTEPGVGYRLRG
jgi:two-component system, OmpR family, KDP operon response regulator KdpE